MSILFKSVKRHLHLFLCFFFIGCLPFVGMAQDTLLQKIGVIPLRARFFTTDPLQQLYIITPENTLVKFVPVSHSDTYQEQYRFSNNTLGELGYIDATDPFNLLLYYPDYQLVVTLDRTLNQTGKLSLIDAGVVQARAVGISNDGNIWVYDEASFQLRKLNRRGEVLFESQNLSLFFSKNAPKPIQIIAQENVVLLNDPAQGILVFDAFGNYNKLLSIPGIAHFQILPTGQLLYVQHGELWLRDARLLESAPIPLPTSLAQSDQLQLQKKRLFVLKAGNIEIYHLK